MELKSPLPENSYPIVTQPVQRGWFSSGIKIGLVMLILLPIYAAYRIHNGDLVQARIQALLHSPLPIPEFLGALEPTPGEAGSIADLVCFTLYQSKLWEVGNEGNRLNDHLLSHLQFSIDGQLITSETKGQYVVTTLGSNYDENGILLGSFGGPIETCYSLENYEGQHMVAVEVSSMSGVLHTYEWAFERVER